ncbi:MAG: phosphoribosylamine--glycine ligase [Capsulimonadaceae bacterium]|nr:phosphoribosylamine--glycine ligase [Capsulimonadaceae bacterium]
MMMNVLVIGGGGREHTLVWKLAQSPQIGRLFCAPGNPGIASVRNAESVPISVTDFDGLTKFAQENNVALTVVGPETPLIAGIVDAFEAKGLRIFGPAREPSQLEGSKVYAKELMRKCGIPTADFVVQSDLGESMTYAREYFAVHPGKKLVVKAEGEAAGKGVMVCDTLDEVESALRRILIDREFGDSGSRVVLEEGLVGREVSLMAFTDGVTVLPMLPAQDHKRARDGDEGPNTGGMGAYAPTPFFTQEMVDRALEIVLKPAVAAIKSTGIPYKGVLYAGLMVEPDGNIKVLEFNCRFGDPETEVVLPLLDTDLMDIMVAVADATLRDIELRWRDGTAVTVVMASGGYPGSYEKGKVIDGLEQVQELSDVVIFHSGTERDASGSIVTGGGRVLSVTGVGSDFNQARARAYAAVRAVHFEGAHYRTDIGHQAMA